MVSLLGKSSQNPPPLVNLTSLSIAMRTYLSSRLCCHWTTTKRDNEIGEIMRFCAQALRRYMYTWVRKSSPIALLIVIWNSCGLLIATVLTRAYSWVSCFAYWMNAVEWNVPTLFFYFPSSFIGFVVCHDDNGDDDVSFLVGSSPRKYSLHTQGIVICERVCVCACLSVCLSVLWSKWLRLLPLLFRESIIFSMHWWPSCITSRPRKVAF